VSAFLTSMVRHHRLIC